MSGYVTYLPNDVQEVGAGVGMPSSHIRVFLAIPAYC